VSDLPAFDLIELRSSVGDSWTGLSSTALPTAEAAAWATVPSCGAVVSFVGTARDHAPGRPGVDLLTYEAYEEAVLVALESLDQEIRSRWPEVVRVALLHRVGELLVGDAAVVVVVASPHRDAAFAAARFGIDAMKATVPIWKRERWSDGESWGLEAQHLEEVSNFGRATGSSA